MGGRINYLWAAEETGLRRVEEEGETQAIESVGWVGGWVGGLGWVGCGGWVGGWGHVLDICVVESLQ